MPLYAADVARACGAGRVDYLDSDPQRLEVAEKIGARLLEGPLPQSAGERGGRETEGRAGRAVRMTAMWSAEKAGTTLIWP